MTRIVLVLVVVVTFSTVPVAQENTLAMLKSMASEANKHLPAMLDKNVELTNMDSQGNILIYNQRLVNTHSTSLTDAEKRALYRYTTGGYHTQRRNQMCSSPDTRLILHSGVTLRISVFYSDYIYITSIDITPELCAQIEER